MRCAKECGTTNVDEFVSFLHGAYPSFKRHQIDTILWDYCQRFQALPATDGAATTGVGVFVVDAWPSSDAMSAGALLEGWTRARRASFTGRSAATREEFLHHLHAWTALDASYGILYVRFPRSGENGLSLDGSGDAASIVEMDDIAAAIERGVYSSENCLLHLGLGWPAAATDEDMGRFLERTGFAAVSGYGKDVGWVDSLAFDLLYVERVALAVGGGRVTPDAIMGCRDLLARKPYRALSRSLDFRLVVTSA